MTKNGKAADALKIVRCAIYTRKSSEEGLEQEFNSLDAQREAGAAYVASQRHEGWTTLPDRYDDGGFTGANTDRPGLRRLLADIQDGKIDVVLVYKVDRLSRSLLDFAQMMKSFDERGVCFVSVTQQFNTATSMGRLILNVLLSFAQFEREIIAERTRDKIAATRRKGKWAGGRPLLGYDLVGSKLVVNETEAEQVREIFRLYRKHGGLLPVVHELERRGWTGKSWQARKGHACGGRAFDRTSLHRLLTNVAYLGQVRYKDEVHTGEHAAIVEPDLFREVQDILHRGGGSDYGKSGALLQGLLRCVPCGRAMTPSYSQKAGKRYRYYICTHAQGMGCARCPSKAVPAGPIERLVVDEVRAVGRDAELRRQVLAQTHAQQDARLGELETERRALEKDLTAGQGELRKLTGQVRPGTENGPLVTRLAELHGRVAGVQDRIQKVREQVQTIRRTRLDDEQASASLAAFEPVWQALEPRERMRVVRLLIERVEYDGARGKVTMAFRPTGIRALAEELAPADNAVAGRIA